MHLSAILHIMHYEQVLQKLRFSVNNALNHRLTSLGKFILHQLQKIFLKQVNSRMHVIQYFCCLFVLPQVEWYHAQLDLFLHMAEINNGIVFNPNQSPR